MSRWCNIKFIEKITSSNRKERKVNKDMTSIIKDITLKYIDKNIIILIELHFVRSRLAIDKMFHMYKKLKS